MDKIMLEQKDLEINHKMCLEMLDVFLEICQKNNIQYCVAEGTALGVVRHKGFIPWDINIDIYLLASEYRKLNDILHTMDSPLEDDIFWDAPAGAGKICGCLLRKNSLELKSKPNIDISILGFVPNSGAARWLIRNIAYFNIKMFKLKNTTVKRKFPFNTLKGISTIISNKVYYGVLEWLLNISDKNEGNKYVMNFTPGWYKARYNVIPKDWLGESTSFGEFENRKVRMMENVHKHLEATYGDYMTPVVWGNKGEYRNAKKLKNNI